VPAGVFGLSGAVVQRIIRRPSRIMKLRHPNEQIAGCCWLPRMADKARAYLAGEMPFLYRVAFGSRVGVDGFFLRYFSLSRPEFLEAIRNSHDDASLEAWFTSQPSVTLTSVAAWNRLAPTLGMKGHPAYLTRHVVKWVLYPRSVSKPVTSLFEAIEQDERP
jgi:hypothetical protein